MNGFGGGAVPAGVAKAEAAPLSPNRRNEALGKLQALHPCRSLTPRNDLSPVHPRFGEIIEQGSHGAGIAIIPHCEGQSFRATLDARYAVLPACDPQARDHKKRRRHRSQRHLRLPEANIPHDEPVHGTARSKIGKNVIDGALALRVPFSDRRFEARTLE
jgi:hypothetical protein